MKKRNLYWLILACLITISLIFSGCEKSKESAPETDETTLGIDVARYQGTIDWKAVAESGVEFAMVRVGYRSQSDGIIMEDVNARYNLQEASDAGIKLGAYFFSTAITEKEAQEEAEWTAKMLADYPITYPVVYDCEGFNEDDSRQYAMTRAERTDCALAFLKTIERKGYQGMFYGSKNDMQQDNHWETSRIQDKYKIWVAQYPDIPYPDTPMSSYAGEYQMWQYSTEGTVPGIMPKVDLNVAFFGYDGITPRQNKQAPQSAKPNVEAMMNFQPVNEAVTAKNEVNLRDVPSQDESSRVIAVLQNGQVAQRIAVCPSGWSKVEYEGQTLYAVSSYLTTDLNHQPDDAISETEDTDGIQTVFTQASYKVTAKVKVNLRALPSVEHPDATVLDQLVHGDIAECTGISDNGWARLVYQGRTCYAVSSYLERADGADLPQTQQPPKPESSETDDIQTQFEPISDRVTAKKEVNLRTLPSVEDPDCKVVVLLKHGVVVNRTGINRDLGWSRVEWNGQTLYCISSYLEAAAN